MTLNNSQVINIYKVHTNISDTWELMTHVSTRRQVIYFEYLV